MKPRVYLTSPVAEAAQNLLAQHCDLDIGTEDVRGEALYRRLANATVLFSKIDTLNIDDAVMAAAPSLRLIARHGSGYNNVDVPAATRRGILVTSTPGANAVAIAEYTIGMMLASTRRLVRAAEVSRLGNPDRMALMGMEVFGKTFGIIGVGNIGREVVRRVHALGMRVLAHHPRPSATGLQDLPLELVDLDTLLANADVVSIHAPLTDATRNLINARELGLMKPTAHLLNVSRGGVVHEEALCAALQAGRLAGYATDVLAIEPVRANEPLLAMPNTLILPHIAAVTPETQQRVAMTAAEDILRVLRGEVPLHAVQAR